MDLGLMVIRCIPPRILAALAVVGLGDTIGARENGFGEGETGVAMIFCSGEIGVGWRVGANKDCGLGKFWMCIRGGGCDCAI